MEAVFNITRNSVVATKLRIAHNFLERLRGLIGASQLARGEGFLIPHCQGVHMLGMKYAIDVIYLDKNGKVVAVSEHLQPNSIGPVYFQSRSVIELPTGAVAVSGTKVGDEIYLDEKETVGLPEAFHDSVQSDA